MSLTLQIHGQAAGILGIDSSGLRDFFLSSLEHHRHVLSSERGAVFKDSPESAVTLVELPGAPSVCIKELRWRGWTHALKGLLRRTQGVRSFLNGWRLREAGFDVACPLSLITERHFGLVRTEWIVMQVIPRAVELDRYILRKTQAAWTTAEKIALVRLFGRYIGSMHAAGIFHSDLKTCNVLVSEDPSGSDNPRDPDASEHGLDRHTPRPVRFALLDYDAVRFSRQISMKQRVKNLVQLSLSTPLVVTAVDRTLFAREYALHAGLAPDERRRLIRSVLDAARGREILYVGFNGDIREKWD
jgi:tRNA A-37 threonylcarbamoyl transferase component Bud32